MAGKAGFGVTIGAVDLASPVLDRINKKILAMNAPSERFNRTMAKFGDVSGVNRLTEGMGALGHNALDAFRSSDRLAGSIAAMTGAGSVAGVVALVDKYSQLGTRLTNTAAKMNMPAAGLSKIEQAGKLAGVSIEATDAAMSGLTRSLMDATYHGDKAAQQTFAALRVDWHNADGSAKTAAETIGVLADAINNLPDGTRKVHALETLGMPVDFLPAIKNGSKGLKDLEDQAVSLGGTMTDKMIKDADEDGQIVQPAGRCGRGSEESSS